VEQPPVTQPDSFIFITSSPPNTSTQPQPPAGPRRKRGWAQVWKKRDVYEMRSAKRDRKFFILPGRANIISNRAFLSQLITCLTLIGKEDGKTSTFLHLFADKTPFSSVVPRTLPQQVLDLVR